MNLSTLDNTSSAGDRRLAEEALGRNLLSCKFIEFCSMRTSFSTIRMIDHTLQKIRNSKASEACHLSLTMIATQSPRGRGIG